MTRDLSRSIARPNRVLTISKHGIRNATLAYGLLLPAFVTVAAFMAYPLYIAAHLSLREGNTMNFQQLGRLPLGLRHYVDALTDPRTWHSLEISLVYTAASTGIAFAIGLGIALLLNRSMVARRWLRTLVLLPWAIPGIVTVLGFLWLLDSSYGVANYLLRTVGVISRDVAWFADPRMALLAVIMPTAWKGYPFFTLMLLAALQAIPGELYEAARVDGGSRFALFRWITWPAIVPTALLALLLNGLWVFREFDFIYATTGGGPAGATETLAIRIYNEAFGFFHMGSASALGVLVLFLCAFAVLVVSSRLGQRFF